jgi:phage terminase large subunit GpA-like protein
MTDTERQNILRYLHAKTNGKSRRHIEGDKVACAQCGSCAELEWHHRKYWSEGGDDSQENLQVLCRPCHLVIHQQKNDFRIAGRWGGLVSAYVREQRLGRKGFCEAMQALSRRRQALRTA